MSSTTKNPVFDVATATLEDIVSVFGVSPLEARIMQLMERGEYNGDIQAVDSEGNPVEEIVPAQTPLLDKADYIK